MHTPRHTLLSLLILCSILRVQAQDTFSIVAIDSLTREVGSAGASCVDLFLFGFTDPSFLGDLLPNRGAINTQASYVPANQQNARQQMLAGDTPAQAIAWLTANDVDGDPSVRQYGIVGFEGAQPRAAAYTGANCIAYKNHLTGHLDGIHYAIQGNILLGQSVLDEMEARFRAAEGDLACRLMAALQGAKVVGADTRCAPNGTSSLFAFVKVAQPTDPYGSPSLNFSVRTPSGAGVEPVDAVQALFDAQHSCLPTATGAPAATEAPKLYPNPAKGEVSIGTASRKGIVQPARLELYSALGRAMYRTQVPAGAAALSLHHLPKGLYFYRIQIGDGAWHTGRVVLE